MSEVMRMVIWYQKQRFKGGAKSVCLFYYTQSMVGFDLSNHFCTTNC